MSAGGLQTAWQETVDRRVLGAFVCVDALTGSSLSRALTVSAGTGVAAWKVKPNRSGVYVVFDGPGFDPQTNQFVPVGAWPAAVSFEVMLQDSQQAYLPRRVQVKAPAAVPAIGASPGGVSPNPAVVAALQNPATVFDPQQVTMYPTAAAAVGPNWSVVRASVTNAATGAGLPWAVVQVTQQSDGAVLATGETGANGEALLAAIGLKLQVNVSGAGPVTVSTVAATVTAIFDPSVLTQTTGWIPNPDDILNDLGNASFKTSSLAVQMGPGEELSLSFAIAI
jgi:hypothetical protein